MQMAYIEWFRMVMADMGKSAAGELMNSGRKGYKMKYMSRPPCFAL
jgi:hypothetical protein